MQLVAAPHVVLIAERDDVAGAERDGAFEVLHAAEVSIVDVQSDGDGRFTGKSLDNRARIICRSIIADNDLIRWSRLCDNALQLRGQKFRAVVSTHRNRDLHPR